MSRVHYFQRFSQRENVDTNNTLLLLSRIQVTDPRLLRDVLAELFADVDVGQAGFEVGVQFSQQTTAPSGSVPDGMLFQSSFRVVLETKRQPTFKREQLQAHLSSFCNESTKVLLLLSPERTDVPIPEAIERGITIVSRTFSEIISACRAADVPENIALRELVEDYELYCFESNLISNEADRLMAIAVGDTFDENINLRLYYSPKSRGFQKHRYIGLYSKKSIRAIGELENIVCADLIDGQLSRENASHITKEQEERIMEAINLAPRHGYDLRSDHRFFLVKSFVRTDFQKRSSGGLQSKRYFSLRNELELKASTDLPDIQTIADSLRGLSWE